MADCAYPDCGRPTNPRIKSATLCRGHENQKRAGIELRPIKVMTHGRLCGYPGCDRPHASRGLCKGHAYQRDTEGKLRPIPRGRYAKPKPDAPKAPPKTEASRLPAGWDRVTPKKPARKPMAGAKVMTIEGPAPEIMPELADAARRLLARHGLDDLADMLGISADREDVAA